MSNTLKIAAILVAVPIATQAEIVGVALGRRAPPAELGGYEMIPFPADERPLYDDVTSVSGPIGDILFDRPVNHRRLGAGWHIWGHGYEGDVYHTNGWAEVTLMLPPGTGSFIVYASSTNDWDEFTATATDGTSVSQLALYYDGHGFGFYTDQADELTSITITAIYDFAVGEFLIAPIPEPGTLPFLALAGLLTARRRG
jgi:hypothetical protein